jgi:hypothetical protein
LEGRRAESIDISHVSDFAVAVETLKSECGHGTVSPFLRNSIRNYTSTKACTYLCACKPYLNLYCMIECLRKQEKKTVLVSTVGIPPSMGLESMGRSPSVS